MQCMPSEMWNPTAKRPCDRKSVTSASDVNSSRIIQISSLVPNIDLIICTSIRLLLLVKTLRERRDYEESVLYPITICQVLRLHSVEWDVIINTNVPSKLQACAAVVQQQSHSRACVSFSRAFRSL
jgi:hypothetical protein